MLESIQSITAHHTVSEWTVEDTRVFIEEWLRNKISSDRIYCTSLTGGVAQIRVGGPVLFQEAWVLQYDLLRAVDVVSGGRANVRELKISLEHV